MLNIEWLMIPIRNLVCVGFRICKRFGIGCLVAMAAVSLFAASPLSSPSSKYDELRLRWFDMLTGGKNLNTTNPAVAYSLSKLSSSAVMHWNGMDRSTARKFLWSDLPDVASNSGQMWEAYGRLKTMALTYATPGTEVHGNQIFLADLICALDWMYTNVYNENRKMKGNWWHWDIGVPLKLNDITVLLYGSLTDKQIANYMNAVDKFSPKPTGTAANLSWTATVVAVRGVLVKDDTKISAAVTSLSKVFPYVTHGDGFYKDGSFVQHNMFAYSGSYGSALLSCVASLLQLFNHSDWQITDSNLTNVYQWVYQAYEPVIYDGAMMDMVRGRAISRELDSDQAGGQQAIAVIICLAQTAPPTTASAFKSMVKHWMRASTGRNFLANANLGIIPLAEAIMADAGIPSRGELVGHYSFTGMDRAVHRRSNYAFGISMFSSRIANYESINKENLRGWFTGDGMTYLYNADKTQFSDYFWPTINPYRLPGTTVDTQLRAAGSGASYRDACNWVGGVTLGDYGIAGIQLAAWHSTLTAKKSWFMFDDEIVCLGAGITSRDNRTIETIVENRKLNAAGNNRLTVNGIIKPALLGWSEAMTNVSWAHLAGSVNGADIGYYFPQFTTLKGLRKSYSGPWHDVNEHNKTKLVSDSDLIRNYLTIWCDHGTNPDNSGYSYVLLPGKSALQVSHYAEKPGIEILENSPAIQAVRQNEIGLTAANFWDDGIHAMGGITVDRKASVLVQVTADQLGIAVSDPTQTNRISIHITINHTAVRVLSLDPGVTVNQLSPSLQLTVNPTRAAGKSFHASFTLTSPHVGK